MRLNYDDIMYVLEHYVTLSKGMWPEPKVDDTGIRRPGVIYNATFETPCIIAAEVARRVRVCGEDGLIVEVMFGMLTGRPVRVLELAQTRRISIEKIYRKLHKVVWYCTDAVFQTGQTYEEWKRSTHGHSRYTKKR